MIDPPPYDRETVDAHRAWLAAIMGEELAHGFLMCWILARTRPNVSEPLSTDLRVYAAMAGLAGVGNAHDRRVLDALLACPVALDPVTRAELADVAQRVNPAPPKQRGRPPKAAWQEVRDLGAAALAMSDHAWGVPLAAADAHRGARVGLSAQAVRAAREKRLAPEARRRGRRPKR